MQKIDLRGIWLSAAELRAVVPRATLDATAALGQVQPLLDAVKTQGAAALYQQAEQFDGVTGHELRVPQEQIADALAAADPQLISALQEMIRRVTAASKAQVPAATTTVLADGATVSQRWQPVHRVGLYVPGGKAVYPSSVVMNAVAALTAGVRELALVSPVQSHGSVDPTILAAAALCGVTEIYAIGGAGAIAALAYGVPEIGLAPVDIITGPGNIFVAAAKRAVTGLVGIDSEAGTTEIMVLADATANPEFVAADLVSQAEHDEAAAAVLVTDAPELADAVAAAVVRRTAETPHSARVQTALNGPQSGIILVTDTAQMIAVADAYAAEHLAIQTADAAKLAAAISNAGALFIGPHSPVSLGDYMAGSNHVLPTGGTGRFAAGLGAHTFLRPQQIIDYNAAALQQVAAPLATIALAEGLPAHSEAVQTRFKATRQEDSTP
ncbi:histidinol dehydrogenase [Canibacter oris]|uniref:Histidinol dehydrogenase n=1 Tax=Canibacter oris TaxID=1365628 RepID=A0A840DPC5_9MICO|nr:histidinol dehydrogenase [Canibacter oris]MBB4071878.1 histidinol dehydrogenase [Canibacter oris]